MDAHKPPCGGAGAHAAPTPHRKTGEEPSPAGAGGEPGPTTEAELRVHGRVLPHAGGDGVPRADRGVRGSDPPREGARGADGRRPARPPEASPARGRARLVPRLEPRRAGVRGPPRRGRARDRHHHGPLLRRGPHARRVVQGVPRDAVRLPARDRVPVPPRDAVHPPRAPRGPVHEEGGRRPRPPGGGDAIRAADPRPDGPRLLRERRLSRPSSRWAWTS